MATVIIPERDIDPLKQLAALPTETKEKFVSALRKAQPSLLLKELHAQIVDEVDVDKDALLGIVRMLGRMYMGRTGVEISAHDFASELNEQLSEISDFPIDLEDEDARSKFTKLISDILSIENSLGVTSKAVGVMTEHEHVYCRCRVLTDIRPVFGDEPDQPKAAVIVHTLRLAFHSQDSHKEIYIAMDNSDVKELISALKRAEKKEQCLASFLDNTQLPLLKGG